MKKVIFVLLALCSFEIVHGQKKESGGKYHYVCIQSTDVYHDRENCASLQMCSGGKIRRTKNVDHLKPCKKCAAPRYLKSNFADIKRILGVKDKKQIGDSLGTGESLIRRPEGFSMRISGLPESKTINMLEFYLTQRTVFNEDSLLSKAFYDVLGLKFDNCRADTIRNLTPHPVTGKVKRDFSIEYRGCAIVEPRDKYEDTSKYFYELIFVAKEGEREPEVEKIQLMLRVERP
ncbi:MAG TPA: hypothetical protein VK666_07595 [Chryseolinea sp.]|nr:hypothetical protein [Chryseolinea sp.]